MEICQTSIDLYSNLYALYVSLHGVDDCADNYEHQIANPHRF